MGAGAEADVGDATPIGAVVDRFAAGERPVGNLIMHKSSLRKHPAKDVVLPAALLVRSFLISAIRYHTFKRTPLFDGQLIGRDMLRPQRNGLRHRAGPEAVGKLGQPEDQVYADIGDAARPQEAERLAGPGGVMSPVHPPQDAIIERLHPHADAVHSQAHQAKDIIPAAGNNIVRIDFDGELLITGRKGGGAGSNGEGAA